MIEEIFEVVLENPNESMITIKTSGGNILLEPVLGTDRKLLPMLVETLKHYVKRTNANYSSSRIGKIGMETGE